MHGKSLEGNLSGDSPDRQVSVYLHRIEERLAKKVLPFFSERLDFGRK